MMLMYYCERWMYLNNYNVIFDIMYEVGIYKQIGICLAALQMAKVLINIKQLHVYMQIKWKQNQ